MEADWRRPTSRLKGSAEAGLMGATDEVWHTPKSLCVSPEIKHLLSCKSWLVQRDTCQLTAVTVLQTLAGDLTHMLYQMKPPQPASVFFKGQANESVKAQNPWWSSHHAPQSLSLERRVYRKTVKVSVVEALFFFFKKMVSLCNPGWPPILRPPVSPLRCWDHGVYLHILPVKNGGPMRHVGHEGPSPWVVDG